MKGTKLIIILILVGAVIAAASTRPDPTIFTEKKETETYSDLFFIYSVTRYPASVEAVHFSGAGTPTIGINLDTSELNFGVVFAEGSSVRRNINLTSKDEKSSKVKLKAYGNIKPLISFSDNDFVFGGKRGIDVTLRTDGVAPGNYSGEIDVIVQRSKYDFLARILGY